MRSMRAAPPRPIRYERVAPVRYDGAVPDRRPDGVLPGRETPRSKLVISKDPVLAAEYADPRRCQWPVGNHPPQSAGALGQEQICGSVMWLPQATISQFTLSVEG